MVAHRAVPNNTRAAFRTCRLLSYKHPTPLSPLEYALPRCPVTAHSKQLTGSAKFFRMCTYIKTGGGGTAHFRLPTRRLLSRPHGFTCKQVYCRDLSPLFLTLAKTVGVYPISALSRATREGPIWNVPSPSGYPLAGGAAMPRKTRTARLRRRISSSARRPTSVPTLVRGTVVILSTIR